MFVVIILVVVVILVILVILAMFYLCLPMRYLGSVFGINFYIIVAKVAGPNGCLFITSV